MRQVSQDLRTGRTALVECPTPQVRRGHLLIDTTVSLISSGTERMLVEFGRGSIVAKARQQPEKVRQVLAKAKTDGLYATLDAVRSKLDEAIPLGYSNVGRVAEIGLGVTGFRIGDRVVSNGPHADVVLAAVNLSARVPDSVSDEDASFAVLGAIALQGVRLARPTIGEAFVVIGAGTIGLLTIQLLRANGCRVLAVDLDASKLELAAALGAETCNAAHMDSVSSAMRFSRALGVDGVIITASTKSSAPMHQAAQMSRKRGRIVLVGVAGLDLDRADFYAKELSFQVSCSYGPGRYDPLYEQEGIDYPPAYVRWTEKRNIEAVLDLLAARRIDVSKLVSRRFPVEQAPKAYDVLLEDKGALGILLTYSHPLTERHAKSVQLMPADPLLHKPVVAFIGAGNYASRILIPAFKTAGARLHTIASAGGTSSALLGRRAGFEVATSDVSSIMQDAEIDAVVVATRHDTHAALTVSSLRANKHVFVEKPLALTREQLAHIEEAYTAAGGQLMVGFNRRFAPLVRRMKDMLDGTTGPKALMSLMNAGHLPADHWTRDVFAGGGRIIGEACHHIDLMRFLVGLPITSVSAMRVDDGVNPRSDNASISLTFADGSLATVHYFTNGSTSFPKERVEAFVDGRILQLDNFRVLRAYGWPSFSGARSLRQDKGQTACVTAFLKAIECGKESPIPPEELFEVARITIEADEQLNGRNGVPRSET
jgi:predicted dehydrogenase/threonine dehydrogenase-like Zn-dependent dehydrogenase